MGLRSHTRKRLNKASTQKPRYYRQRASKAFEVVAEVQQVLGQKPRPDQGVLTKIPHSAAPSLRDPQTNQCDTTLGSSSAFRTGPRYHLAGHDQPVASRRVQERRGTPKPRRQRQPAVIAASQFGDECCSWHHETSGHTAEHLPVLALSIAEPPLEFSAQSVHGSIAADAL